MVIKVPSSSSNLEIKISVSIANLREIALDEIDIARLYFSRSSIGMFTIHDISFQAIRISYEYMLPNSKAQFSILMGGAL